MKRTSLITAALLALLLAPAVQAQYPGNGNRYPSRDADRYPDYGHMDRVSVLAHEIDATARGIYRQAARNNRRPNPYEAQMLDDLQQLAANAAHFHDEVEGNRQNPRHTAHDFARLEESFNQLGATMQNVRPRPYVDRGMQQIYSRMTELSRYYGGNGYNRWGHYGHDRNDRDRYNRDQDRDNRDNGYRPPQH
ncbi:MAG TPA: hypothetical protein VF173_15785 [Thermoanaerobaculia bacterium]|nr:hypothetical protein [Thermoanaerobaculia bacterium]